MKICVVVIIYVCSISSFAQGLVINEIMTSNDHTISDQDGEYVDWIELYNRSSSPINLQNFKLSDDPTHIDKWSFPSISIDAYGFLIVFASGKDRNAMELHTNFKIKSSGEVIILSDQTSFIIDSIPPVSLETDKTYGRLNDGTPNLGFLSDPTPNQSNNSQQFINEIIFSDRSGFYKNSFDLTLTSDDSVYYTLDGSMPSLQSNLYTDPISISSIAPNTISLIPTNHIPYVPNIWPNDEFGFQTPQNDLNKGVVLRAMSFKNGAPTSKVYSHTYFTENIEYTFPVISLITDSLNLFDRDTGIYLPGTHLDSSNMDWTGNYYQRGDGWERMGNIDFFDDKRNLVFSEAVGFRISGQKSRSAPQKSIRLYFRDEYGSSKINYPFFRSRNYSDFKRIILRSSFTYWWGRNTLFQDDLLHTFVSQNNLDIDVQMSRPSILFINGEYWGIHNIRERQDKHYLESIHGIDGDSVDIIEGNMSVEGNAYDFIELINFVELNDLSNPLNYEFVKNKIDIDNYIDYFIVEMYFNNQDWPANNVKIWRLQSPHSKWRWMLYDLDAAMSDYEGSSFDYMSGATDKQSVLFNSLLRSNAFKNKFLDRFIFHLKTTFNPNRMNELIHQFQSIYEPEIAEHISRWSNPVDYNSWKNSCDFLRTFIENRPCHMKDILIDQFNLKDMGEFDCLYNNSFDVKIFPNPSSGKFTLSMNKAEEVKGSITVFNGLGQNVYNKIFNSNISQIDLSFLGNGIYFFRLDIDGGYETKKIVID